jgi:hypothetical protein
MQRKEKPFVLYRRGPMNFRIVPRGLMGWLQFGLWVALAGMLVSWFVSHATKPPFARGEVFEDVLFLFVFGMVVWLIAGLWWMRAHAEEVDIVEHLRDRQRERLRARQRARRGDGGGNGHFGGDGGYSDSDGDGGD